MGRTVFLASEQTSFAILTATKKETFWRIFRIFRPVGCKEKLWALFLPRVHLEKTANTPKICKVLFMTQDFQRNFTLNACLRQTSWINIVVVLTFSLNDIIFLSWLFVKISFYRFSDYGFQSYMNIACRSTQNAACIKWIWSLEVKCKRKCFWDLFLLVFIQTLEAM